MKPCKIWTGWIGKNGYGLLLDEQGDMITAHKKVWVDANGPVPEGLEILHSCNNKPCYEKTHLSLGTRQQNVQDALRDGLLPTGERCSWSKLTLDQVRQIRIKLKEGVLGKTLASEFHVSPAMICKINLGRSWRHDY